MVQERTDRASNRELNIVLKELRKAQMCSTDEASLRQDVVALNTEVVRLKTILSVTAAAVIVVWTVFGSLALGGLSEWKANSKAIVDHEYRLLAHKEKINRLHEENK